MLVSLHVKNLALIDETEVMFREGLNILSGETGAGKSIIIGSINLALGARAEKDMIRGGADSALVELVFQTDTQEQLEVLKELDIEPEDGNTIIIQRKIMESRSVCKINGMTATTRQLKELAGFLIDIHGQHEHQSLLDKKKHVEILDDFAGDDLISLKNSLILAYREYQNLQSRLREAENESVDREKELSLLEFEIKEISEAHLEAGEDALLEADYRKMVNSKKIKENAYAAYGLTGNDQGAGDLVGRALRELKSISGLDLDADTLEGQLEELEGILSDFNRSLSEYLTDLEFSEEDFYQAEKRLNQLNHLKSKYGRDINEILSGLTLKQERLEHLQDFDAYKQNLANLLEGAQKEVEQLCGQLSDIRRREAKFLQQEIVKALLDLNFLSVRFSVSITRKDHYTETGFDDIEFLISTNPGESEKPLGQVASGGELSRIMLAIKAVMAARDKIYTLIFDEIDAGISGKTAWKVSEKLAVLAHNHQIICITHLPQIAAMADHHFVIVKTADSGITTTQIAEIGEDETLEELARMLGGEKITDAVLLNAKELKELAGKTKQY